jgi:hypothetical protein
MNIYSNIAIILLIPESWKRGQRNLNGLTQGRGWMKSVENLCASPI